MLFHWIYCREKMRNKTDESSGFRYGIEWMEKNKDFNFYSGVFTNFSYLRTVLFERERLY